MSHQAPPTHPPPEPTDDSLADRADAFAALANECRLSIVTHLAPADARARASSTEAPERAPPVLAYSELKARTGVRDGGRFNYHLRELQPEFVESVDAGYRLTEAGLGAARLVLAGPLPPAEATSNRSSDGAGGGVESDGSTDDDRTTASTTRR